MEHLIDYHAHILPRLDHGSDSLETSMEQMRLAIKHGIRRIVATSHFYAHRHKLEEFLERRSRAYAELIEALKATYGEEAPEIHLGAEVLLCAGLENLEGLEKLCLEGTNLLLLELPFHPLADAEKRTVHKLMRKGFFILLAHADRYEKSDIEELLSYGVKIQLNADALCRLFAPRHLLDWVRRDEVYAIGSDIHKADEGAYKRFLRAEKKLGKYASAVRSHSDGFFIKSRELL